MAVTAPGQLNVNESPSWGSRSVDCFEKLEQIGEGTYGSAICAYTLFRLILFIRCGSHFLLGFGNLYWLLLSSFLLCHTSLIASFSFSFYSLSLSLFCIYVFTDIFLHALTWLGNNSCVPEFEL